MHAGAEKYIETERLLIWRSLICFGVRPCGTSGALDFSDH